MIWIFFIISLYTNADLPRLIDSLSFEYGVNSCIVKSVAYVESGMHHYVGGKVIVNRTNDIGVMQIHDATARALGGNPYDVIENIKMGIRYLIYQYETARRKGKGDPIKWAISAYNRGGSAFRYVSPPNKSYVSKVLRKVKTLGCDYMFYKYTKNWKKKHEKKRQMFSPLWIEDLYFEKMRETDGNVSITFYFNVKGVKDGDVLWAVWRETDFKCDNFNEKKGVWRYRRYELNAEDEKFSIRFSGKLLNSAMFGFRIERKADNVSFPLSLEKTEYKWLFPDGYPMWVKTVYKRGN